MRREQTLKHRQETYYNAYPFLAQRWASHSVSCIPLSTSCENPWYIMTICSLRPFLKFTKSLFCCVASSAQTRSVYFRLNAISRMHTIFKYTTTAKEIVYDKSWEHTSLVLDFSLWVYQTSLVVVYSPSHNVLKLKQATALPSEVNAGTKQGTLGTNTESCITTHISWLSDEEETLTSSACNPVLSFLVDNSVVNGATMEPDTLRPKRGSLFDFFFSLMCLEYRGVLNLGGWNMWVHI